MIHCNPQEQFAELSSTTVGAMLGCLGVLTASLLFGEVNARAAESGFVFEGSQYAPAGSLSGDQLNAVLAIEQRGGLLVWQDNTDGDGNAIRSRLLGSQINGLLQPNYVNETVNADQERPAVVSLPSGGYFVAWQSGLRGAQKIVGRVLLPTGVFATGEIAISGAAADNRGVALSALKDGSLVAAWTATDVDGHMDGVQIRRLSASGQTIGEPQVVNDFTQFGQRDPVVAALQNGGFAVVWVSEQQVPGSPAALYAKSFSPAGLAVTGELLLAGGKNPIATPVALGTPTGFLVVWSEFKLEDSDLLWDISARAFEASGNPTGSTQKVNSYSRSNQLKPKIALAQDKILAIYESVGVDGSGVGVAAQFLDLQGARIGDEFIINSSSKGDQFAPSLASDSAGRLVAVWSHFGSADVGLEIQAQRLNREQAPLIAPSAPYLLAASSSRLTASWPALDGLPVERYEVYFDGVSIPLSTADNFATFSQLAPSSLHQVKLVYVLKDGRKSPPSTATSARTWAEDDNADGLPDDWQSEFFGPDAAGWPSPDTDSDGDGMSNRAEFLSGTNPQSAVSVLKTSLTTTAQGTVLSWNSVPGAFYQVQYSLDLKSWENLGARQLSTGSVSGTPVSDAPANSYFRVNFLR